MAMDAPQRPPRCPAGAYWTTEAVGPCHLGPDEAARERAGKRRGRGPERVGSWHPPEAQEASAWATPARRLGPRPRGSVRTVSPRSTGEPWTSPASSQEWAGRHWAVAEHPVSIFLAQEADVRPEAAGDRAEGCGRSRPEVWLPSPGTPVWPGTWSESLISHTGQGARLWPWPPGRRGAMGWAACCRAA